MSIYSVAYYIIVGESTSTNGLKRFILRLKSIIAVGKIEVSNLYKTFLDLEGIGKIPIHSLTHCIIVGKSASTDGLKYLIPHFKYVIAAGETEVSDLYKIF